MSHSYSSSFRRALLGLALGLSAAAAQAQTPIVIAGTPYPQTFDAIGASGTSYPAGWTGIRLSGSGTANETLNPVVVAAASNSGAVYNAGTDAGTDRALGSLASGTTVPAFGAVFLNQTGAAANRVNISARAEQWRTGSDASITERLIFEYSFDATSLSTGTWTAVPALDIVERATTATTAGPLDGNDQANSTNINASIPVNWPAGSNMWIRWRDNNDVGSDALLALDNFLISTAVLGTRTAQKGSLSVYPNPTADVLNLRLNGRAATGPVTVTDLTGRLVLTGTAGNGTLDVRALPAGYYLVQTAEGATHQLVKQ